MHSHWCCIAETLFHIKASETHFFSKKKCLFICLNRCRAQSVSNLLESFTTSLDSVGSHRINTARVSGCTVVAFFLAVSVGFPPFRSPPPWVQCGWGCCRTQLIKLCSQQKGCIACTSTTQLQHLHHASSCLPHHCRGPAA